MSAIEEVLKNQYESNRALFEYVQSIENCTKELKKGFDALFDGMKSMQHQLNVLSEKIKKMEKEKINE